MDREVLFAQTLEQVRRQAREQGNCVEEEQVREAFASLELNETQLQMVFDYLTKHQIGIGTPQDPDALLSDEEKDYLQIYIEELEALPDYSPGEIEGLTRSAMAGDEAASRKLVEAYLREVAQVARLYVGQGVGLEDLIGEGNMALTLGIRLLGGLDTPKEAPGMLIKCVMDAMEEQIREHADSHRQDQKMADKVNRVAAKARAMAEEMRRKVTPEELAKDSGMSLQGILEALRLCGNQIEDIEYAEDSL